jgi:hypothetical protein
VIAASRFEGGSWVRVGFLLTYTAFAYGCVVVGAAALRLPHHWRRPGIEAPTGHLDAPESTWLRWVAAASAVASIAALALPAIRFPTETLSGFRGLDALSVIIAVSLASVVFAGVSSPFARLRLSAASCLAGVLGGNLVIQRFTTRGTTVEYGLWWATGLALLACVAALGVRGRPEERR